MVRFWFLLYFCNGYQSGIRYDLPKVRAVAYRFSTTYLLHSAADLTGGNQDERTPATGLFRFSPVLFYHIYFDVVVELCRLLKLDGYSYVLDFPIKDATAFEIQVSYNVVAFVGLALSKVVIDGIYYQIW